jgi:hypothetical protein
MTRAESFFWLMMCGLGPLLAWRTSGMLKRRSNATSHDGAGRDR